MAAETHPHEICEEHFVPRQGLLKAAWAVGGVLIAVIISAVSWAFVTNHSVTVLETKQESIQQTIDKKLDVIIAKIDNTRVGQ